jgi:hypothetical protein
VASALVEWDDAPCVEPVTPPGSCSVVSTAPVSGASDAAGIATVDVTGVKAFAGGTAEVFVTAVTDPGSNRLYFKPLDGQFGFWGQVAVP